MKNYYCFTTDVSSNRDTLNVFYLQIMQGFGVGLLLRRFDEKKADQWAAFGLVWACCSW